MLGLFDSGLGGLTVLRRVREALPLHDLIFFADQANVPYGDRAPADLLRLAEHNLGWLEGAGAQAVIVACNTSCAAAAQLGWPAALRIPVLDLIESAAVAVERAGYSRIGVVATAATARSGAYRRALTQRIPGARVIEIAAPQLVPLVEAGKLHDAQTHAAVAEACAPLAGEVDAVVLGCTHYPLLHEHFSSVLGSAVALLDPAVEHAGRAKSLAERLGIPPGTGRVECVTSGNLERFEASLRTLIPDILSQVRRLEPVEG